MKFYYDGKLIRTSKTHHYTHAVVNTATGKCLTCSSTLKGCEQFVSSHLNGYRCGIKNCKTAIKAIEDGKTRYNFTDGRRTFVEKIYWTKEEYEERIADREDSIERIEKNWKIVELEER